MARKKGELAAQGSITFPDGSVIYADSPRGVREAAWRNLFDSEDKTKRTKSRVNKRIRVGLTGDQKKLAREARKAKRQQKNKLRDRKHGRGGKNR